MRSENLILGMLRTDFDNGTRQCGGSPQGSSSAAPAEFPGQGCSSCSGSRSSGPIEIDRISFLFVLNQARAKRRNHRAKARRICLTMAQPRKRSEATPSHAPPR